MRREALPWNLTVIGEAVNRLAEDLRGCYPDFPWSQPVRLRRADERDRHRVDRLDVPSKWTGPSSPNCPGWKEIGASQLSDSTAASH